MICLNWIPKLLKNNIKLNEKILKDIKLSTNNVSVKRFWMWPDNASYNDENLPDSQKYLIGIYYGIKNVNFFN